MLSGTAVAEKTGPSLEELQRNLAIIGRAKELHDAELLELQAQLSREVIAAWHGEHADILHQLGDHLAQAKALMLDEAQLVENLRSDGADVRGMTRPHYADVPRLFQQLRLFDLEKWNIQLSRQGY
jgi:hypothetical protein